MRQIRRNVFETNSSSTHSVSVSNNGCLEDNMMRIVDNKILVSFHEFGWENDVFYDQEHKLSYLILMIMHTNGIGSPWCCDSEERSRIIEALYKDSDFVELSEAITGYTGTDGIIIDEDSEGYIDHQSWEDYACLWNFLDEYGISTVIDFVFDSGVILYTGNDNG